MNNSLKQISGRKPALYRRTTVLALLCLGINAQGQTTPSRDLADHPEVRGALDIVDAWIDGYQAYSDVPGISVGLVVDQELVFNKGYGYANLRRKVPADADTIYSICSISKLFTSMSVMQLRDAGKLSLRDPVAKHLDWFNIEPTHPQAGPTRIHGLLTHSSGLPRESHFPYWYDEPFPFPEREALRAKLAEQQTLYPADTLYQYSNLGLTLAGEIVEEVSGQPYADYVQSQLLDPLGLTDTRPYFPKDLHGNQMAIGYRGLQRDGKRKPVKPFDTRAIAPAAGYTSTVRDLGRFASWQFSLLADTTDASDDGSAETQEAATAADNVLNPNTLREMQRVHWVDEDWKTSWGLGFGVRRADNSTLVGHSGGCPGYITDFTLSPKNKVATVVLTNAGDGRPGNISRGMLKVVGPAIKTAMKSAPAVNNEADVGAEVEAEDAVDLADYAGNYSGGVWGGETAVRVWDDKLATIRIPSASLNEVTKLKHVEADVFVRLTKTGDPRENWSFQRDKQGNVSGVLLHSQVYQRQ